MSALGGKADILPLKKYDLMIVPTGFGIMSAFAVAIGGKADMGLCAAHVRF